MDRFGKNKSMAIAYGQTLLTVAQAGSDRTKGFEVAESSSGRTNAVRLAEGGADRPGAGRIS
ncbi:hypothetical protein ACFW0H_00060 [Pseudomonas sp. CR3202]|uniref:hypothetical protein n=1 Tax=Pseudomonas sp. CR3202 TaxID=3351532 RepID=UPI003BEFF281